MTWSLMQWELTRRNRPAIRELIKIRTDISSPMKKVTDLSEPLHEGKSCLTGLLLCTPNQWRDRNYDGATTDTNAGLPSFAFASDSELKAQRHE